MIFYINSATILEITNYLLALSFDIFSWPVSTPKAKFTLFGLLSVFFEWTLLLSFFGNAAYSNLQLSFG